VSGRDIIPGRQCADEACRRGVPRNQRGARIQRRTGYPTATPANVGIGSPGSSRRLTKIRRCENPANSSECTKMARGGSGTLSSWAANRRLRVSRNNSMPMLRRNPTRCSSGCRMKASSQAAQILGRPGAGSLGYRAIDPISNTSIKREINKSAVAIPRSDLAIPT
jgi:hypothetical protein